MRQSIPLRAQFPGLTLSFGGSYNPELVGGARVLGEIMPNHKSAEKRMRQSERRRKINRSNRTRVRTAIKKLRTELSAGNVAEAKAILPETISTIDKAVRKGVMHQNAAARYKARLTKGTNAAAAK